VTTFRTLGDSRCPCARVLSVAGFFTVLRRFPGRIGFIPEVTRASFLGGKPTRVEVRAKAVINPLEECNGEVVRLRYPGCVRAREAYIRDIQQERQGGRHTRVGISLLSLLLGG